MDPGAELLRGVLDGRWAFTDLTPEEQQQAVQALDSLVWPPDWPRTYRAPAT